MLSAVDLPEQLFEYVRILHAGVFGEEPHISIVDSSAAPFSLFPVQARINDELPSMTLSGFNTRDFPRNADVYLIAPFRLAEVVDGALQIAQGLGLSPTDQGIILLLAATRAVWQSVQNRVVKMVTEEIPFGLSAEKLSGRALFLSKQDILECAQQFVRTDLLTGQLTPRALILRRLKNVVCRYMRMCFPDGYLPTDPVIQWHHRRLIEGQFFGELALFLDSQEHIVECLRRGKRIMLERKME